MLADRISRRSDGMALPEGLQVFIDIYAAVVTELICEWLLGRRMIPLDQFPDILVQALPQPLIPYLHDA